MSKKIVGALYDAIKIGSQELLLIDRELPYNYLKVVLVITDGGDNDSCTSLTDLSYFLETDLCLCVIGVGNSTQRQLQKLDTYALSTHSIAQFADLYQAMTISLGVVIERQRYVRF
ncbi:MAG: hypothetical protein DSM107014_09885 [Gomphosphaeria aponina SAG 52.96 = DSM 107014]|uniref:VWFA domain-containing protein n=1 Tax=Gomphosphaeria aponina SAG 52.96 = DSM 107014 TaxID=1521640 RepID=A0A941GPZ2_9CHRO|nr:hypothetical protein [Gomphosphaeria aponina SAG 52.96 = DSM 107014]